MNEFILEETEYIGMSSGDSAVVRELDQLVAEEGIMPAGGFLFDATDGDASGSMAILAEMNSAFSTLDQEMMAIEHNSIVHEDVEILHEAKEGFWAKIGNIFKTIWATIKKWWGQAVSFLQGLLGNAEKWLQKNEKKMKQDSAKVMTYPNVASGSIIKDAAKVEPSTGGDTKSTPAQRTKEMAELDKEGEVWFGASEPAELVIKKDKAIGNIKGSNSLLAKLKKANSVDAAIIKSGLAQTKEAQKLATTKKDTSAQKKAVDGLKWSLGYNRKLNALILKAAKRAVGDSFKACRKMMGAAAKEEK